MSFRNWLLKTLFANTAAAHGMRDAARGFPSERDFVEIPIYEDPVRDRQQAAEEETVPALAGSSQGARS